MKKNKLNRNILISIALGALVYIVFVIYADFNSLYNALASMHLWFIPIIFGLSFINYIIRFIKWDYYLRLLKIDISKLDSCGIFFSGLSMSVTPGKMGELLKCYILKKIKGTPISVSTSIVFAERITDFISLIIIAVFGAYIIGYGREISVLFGILFLVLIFIISSRTISLKIINMFEKIKILNKFVKSIHNLYEGIYVLIKIKPLLFTVLISLIGWSCECLGFYLTLEAFNTHFKILSSSFIYAFSTLVGALLFLPGGLGFTEGSLTGLLMFAGIGKGISVASTFIIRAATLWFAVLLGAIVLLIYQKRLHLKFEELENFKEK
jgi:glycosyltransferase 2 family protein